MSGLTLLLFCIFCCYFAHFVAILHKDCQVVLCWTTRSLSHRSGNQRTYVVKYQDVLHIRDTPLHIRDTPDLIYSHNIFNCSYFFVEWAFCLCFFTKRYVRNICVNPVLQERNCWMVK